MKTLKMDIPSGCHGGCKLKSCIVTDFDPQKWKFSIQKPVLPEISV
jgi:hypothetical protein